MDIPEQFLSADIEDSTSLRNQALDLFDRCLMDSNTAPIIAFIERQIAHEPPDLEFLRDLSDDLQQRLLSLRAYHYDVRNNIVALFKSDYNLDITPIMPAGALAAYHLLDPQGVLAYVEHQGVTLTADEMLLLRELITASVEGAAHLQADIQLTTDLLEMVLDWLDAMCTATGRNYWFVVPESSTLLH